MFQALALPAVENPNAPEHMPISEDAGEEHIPKNEVVEQFRTDLFYWFHRFQSFYDRCNAATRDYRVSHVRLITAVYNELITILGDDIQSIRESGWAIIELLRERQEVLGEDNACLIAAGARFATNSDFIGPHAQSCSTYANNTMEALLTNTFYPAFADIKNILAVVPLIVTDALSRGNVLQDEAEIIELLRARYQIVDFQWMRAVSQLLRWESNRFDVDGRFLVDEMRICLAHPTIVYILENAEIEQDIIACS